MIGATTSQTLDLTLLNKGDMVYGTSTIKVEIGLKIGSTVEYIPIGIFNIDDIEKTDYTIKITAFDNMIKFERNFITNLGDTLTLQQVVSELTRITGVQFTGTLPSYSVKKLKGFSCREVLSFIASLCGGNAIITRDGKFTIVTPKDNTYNIGTSNYFDYKREETKYKIGKVSCQVGEEVLSKGSLGTDSMELEFENPWVNTTIITDIYNKLNGFEYLGYSMKWQGDPSLDVGDIVTITDKKGVVRKLPILSQKFNYTGGLTSEISAKGENKNKNEFSSSGPSTKKVERVVMELALINKALIDVAYIGDLTANNIKFNTASGGTLDLQSLLVKFVSGENGQYLNLTSSNVVIDNAVIKDTIAANISVQDLKAGNIDANRFNIVGTNGNLLIKDNTIQIKDANRTRVQIGKDASNDYNMYVWDSTGKLMFDATGLKADGIKSKIIRDDMVSDTANINGSKINISSLVTEVNKDTNTQLIKASKVAIDLTGQSLEVSFNSLKSNVDDNKSKTESNTTSINVINGQISALISESTITKGDVTTLKNNYTSLNATVDGINTTVASHTSSIGTLNSNVSTMQSSITQLNNKIALKVEATDIANAIKEIEIGGRNILRNTQFKNMDNWNVNSSVDFEIYAINSDKNAIHCKSFASGGTRTLRQTIYISANEEYTLSFYIKNTDISRVWIGAYYNNRTKYFNIYDSKWSVRDNYIKLSYTFKTPADLAGNSFSLEIWNYGPGEYYIQDLKLEKGNKSTDWTPAPEDVDQSISTVDGKVSTLNTTVSTVSNKVATIETSLSSITSRVSSTESSITTINGNVSNLTTKVNTVEQSITATALTTTISSAINAGTSSISTTQFIMDKTGLTIKNGALTIQNKAGTNVLTSDTNGNLTITGAFVNKNGSGVDSVRIDNNTIYFYDWERSARELGYIYSSFLSNYPNCRGFSLGHHQQSYMNLTYRKTDGTYAPYLTLDKYNINPTYTSAISVWESVVFSQAVKIQERLYMPNTLYLGSDAGSTVPRIYGASNKLVMQVSVSNKGDGIQVQSNSGGVLASIIAGNSYPTYFNTSTYIDGNFAATGTKARLVNTQNYGGVKLNAVESADAVFEDIGEGIIDEVGLCYIYLDPVMQETINTKCSYQVFLQKYGEGDLFVLERNENYFAVKGTSNLRFGWRFVAKQKGYETERLEQEKINITEEYLNNIEHDKEVNYEDLAYSYLEDYEKELISVEY